MLGIHNALVGYKSYGFQGVSDWSQRGNPTMLKTPNQSLVIPYRPKVGANNEILEMIENSGDRLRDDILPYARGQNPMVGVQMQNSGGVFSNRNEVSLPYKLSSAFRPPIQRREDLMPLSRLPRTSTEAYTQIKAQKREQPDHIIPDYVPLLEVQADGYAAARPYRQHETEMVQLNNGATIARSNDVVKSLKTKEFINFENPKVYLPDPLVTDPQTTAVYKGVIHTLSDYSYTTQRENAMNTQVDSNKSFKLDNYKPQELSQNLVSKIQYSINPEKKYYTKPVDYDVKLTKQNESLDYKIFKNTQQKLSTDTGVDFTTSAVRDNLIVLENADKVEITPFTHDDLVYTRVKDRPVSNFSFSN